MKLLKWLRISGFSNPCTAGTHMLVCAATLFEMLEDSVGSGSIAMSSGTWWLWRISSRGVAAPHVRSPPRLWDNNLLIARGARSTLRCWKWSRRSQERYTSTSSSISCAMLETMLTATDWTHRCNRMSWRYTVIHRGTLLRRYFFGLQGTQWMQNSAKGVSCTSTRGETSPQDPIENNHLAVYDETSLVSPDDCLASDLFLPGARSMQYRLSDYNVAKSRWYHFPKIQMDVVLQFEQFDSDTALPERMTCHTTFVDPTVRSDAIEKQSIECSVLQFFLDFEPNTCPSLPSVAVAKEVAFSDERGAWDLSLVRELSEWMRNDVYSEVLVGRMFVNLDMKFAEIACRDPATTAAVVDLTVLRTPRGEWKIRGNSLPFGRLSLNSLSVCTIPVRGEPICMWRCHRHDYDLTWFGHRDTVVYGVAGAIGQPIGLNCEYRKYLRTIAGIRMSR